MADPTYTPPEVWTHDAENGGTIPPPGEMRSDALTRRLHEPRD